MVTPELPYLRMRLLCHNGSGVEVVTISTVDLWAGGFLDGSLVSLFGLRSEPWSQNVRLSVTEHPKDTLVICCEPAFPWRHPAALCADGDQAVIQPLSLPHASSLPPLVSDFETYLHKR